MTDKSKQQYLDFEAYDRVAEPHKRERASAWRTPIGLQDVDGLKVSDYLKKTAVRHIEGDITIDEVREQLKSYYVNKTTHDEDDAEKEEADRVAANIAKLLSEQSFSFTTLEFLNIHRHLFEGVFKHAGEVRIEHWLDIYPKSVIRISLCRTAKRNPNDRFGFNESNTSANVRCF